VTDWNSGTEKPIPDYKRQRIVQ